MYNVVLNTNNEDDVDETLEAVADDTGLVHFLGWEPKGGDAYTLIPTSIVNVDDLMAYIPKDNNYTLRVVDLKDNPARPPFYNKGLGIMMGFAGDTDLYVQLVVERSGVAKPPFPAVFKNSKHGETLFDDVLKREAFAILENVESEGRTVHFDGTTPEVVEICRRVCLAVDWRGLGMMWGLRKLRRLFAGKLTNEEICSINLESLASLQKELGGGAAKKRKKTTVTLSK